MQLPDSVKQIRAAYVARFPIPQGAPGPEIEDAVRQWSIGLAEQVAFSLPGQGWGTKRADPNRPISKDGLARQVDGRLLIWDMVTGAGTGQGRLVDDPDSEDITGQVFVAVTPTNHLGAPSPGPSDPVPPTVDFGPLAQQLAATNQKIDALIAQQQQVWDAIGTMRDSLAIVQGTVAALSDRPTPKQPIAYSGALGYRLRLTPEYGS